MSSAPPGWHRQPDGRDRYWDGGRWTDEFRDPAEATTQQIPLDETRSMPTGESASGYASQPPPSGAPGAYPPPAPGVGGYGPPPGAYGGPPPPQRQGGGWLKGCLIALLVVIVLVALLAVGGIWLFRSASDRVAESIESSAPVQTSADAATETPGDTATETPGDTATETPGDTQTDSPLFPEGEVTEAGLGEEFTVGNATIQSGWAVEEVGLGLASVTMTAVSAESVAVPLVFDIVFFEGDTDITRTTCTVPSEPVGEPVEVGCVPVLNYTDGVDRIQAIVLEIG